MIQRHWTWPVAFTMAALLLQSVATAANDVPAPRTEQTHPLRPENSRNIHAALFVLQETSDETPFEEEPPVAPMPEAAGKEVSTTDAGEVSLQADAAPPSVGRSIPAPPVMDDAVLLDTGEPMPEPAAGLQQGIGSTATKPTRRLRRGCGPTCDYEGDCGGCGEEDSCGSGRIFSKLRRNRASCGEFDVCEVPRGPTDGCDVGCLDTCETGCFDGCGIGRFGFAGGRRNTPWLTVGGWIDQGITYNADSPTDRFNGPVTFNDRDREYQMNQVDLFVEREADTGGYGWDIGGRFDVLYGTDGRFTVANGLEDNWNDRRFYWLSVPQAYVDVAVNDLNVRLGHFYTIIGYEVVPAPQNFFYSHAYTMQYGEPFTHTGVLASLPLGDQLTASAGVHRGWDNWEDNNEEMNFLGGLNWTSHDGRTSAAFAIDTGAYDDAGLYNRTMYSVVLTRQINDRLVYVIQHDYGFDNNGSVVERQGVQHDAEWYGINQYLFYEVDSRLSLGMRVEWFRDDDGTRVGGLGAPNGWTGGPDLAANQIGFAGDFFAITGGLNWKPYDNLVVRPEVRWDWYNGPRSAAGELPYDSGEKDSQFTLAADVYFTF